MGRQQARSDASTAKALGAALKLFSHQGYGATSMREIAAEAGLSVGNLYHHFGNKEAIFQSLIDHYWKALLDPDLELNRVFARARFPDDLEEMAAAIELVVEKHQEEILLIYVDVIEFRGRHIRTFYESMADRFQEAYSASFEEARDSGRLGEVNPLVAVMVATRWLFYFFTVEKCFGVPMHFGMRPKEAVGEFARILRYGLLPRSGEAAARPDAPEDMIQERGRT
jgi:TetR/AcrR family transcriptional regulator, acrAB operon repressor